MTDTVTEPTLTTPITSVLATITSAPSNSGQNTTPLISTSTATSTSISTSISIPTLAKAAVAASNVVVGSSRTLNLERLYFARTDIPLLVGYVNGIYEGVKVLDWIRHLEDLFTEEKIISENEKLATYKRYIHPEKGSARQVITKIKGIVDAKSFDEFKRNLLCILSPLTVETGFKQFIKLITLPWKNNTVFPTFVADIQGVLDDLEDTLLAHYGMRIPENFKFFIVFGLVYGRTPVQFSQKMEENFDPTLSYPEQIRRYLSKTSNNLNFPFRNDRHQINTPVGQINMLQQSPHQPGIVNTSLINNRGNIAANNRSSSTRTNQNRTRTQNRPHFNPQTTTPCKQYHSRGSIAVAPCFNTVWDPMNALNRNQYINSRNPRQMNKGNGIVNRARPISRGRQNFRGRNNNRSQGINCQRPFQQGNSQTPRKLYTYNPSQNQNRYSSRQFPVSQINTVENQFSSLGVSSPAPIYYSNMNTTELPQELNQGMSYPLPSFQ